MSLSYLTFPDPVNKLLLAGAHYRNLKFVGSPKKLQRYRRQEKLWQLFLEVTKQTKLPFILMIGGASNVGKSSWSLEIAYRLGIRNVVHTDTLRNTLRAILDRKKEQDLFLPTYRCWKPYSKKFNPRALLKGFEKQCHLITPYIHSVIQDAENYGKFTVIEGIHIVPSYFTRTTCDHPNILILMLDIPSSGIHRRRLGVRSESTYLNRRKTTYLRVFKGFRTIRDYLVQDAEKSSVAVVENRGGPETLDQLLGLIFEHVLVSIDSWKKKRLETKW